jgi:SAM-dependent methyltransferase
VPIGAAWCGDVPALVGVCLYHRGVDPEPVSDHGYSAIDDLTDSSGSVSMMDATSQWPATVALRAWERERLALRPGERLIDVGCGPGDAAISLAGDLGSTGELVAVDTSQAMLEVARVRLADLPCRVAFAQQDALALQEPAEFFDAARCERTLQWVSAPAQGVAELFRVLRPGGRATLIDTDWSSLVLEIGDERLSGAVRTYVSKPQTRAADVGRRLWGLCRDAGFVGLEATAATHVWTRWDPDRSPAPGGLFSFQSLAEDLHHGGHLDQREASRFLPAVEAAARDDRLFMTLTMYAVAGRRP